MKRIFNAIAVVMVLAIAGVGLKAWATGPADASSSNAAGPGVITGVVNTLLTYTVIARDANGTALNHGGDNYHSKVRDPNGKRIYSTFIDNNNGTYTGTYTPQMTGVYEVTPRLNGKLIGGSPYLAVITAN